MLPDGWRSTLGAIDGATTEDFGPQISALPPDATHIVVSIGGNDALGHIDLLGRPARSSAEVLAAFAAAAESFERRYRRAVAGVIGRGVPVTLCTIYNGNFPEVGFQRLASTALTVFNDVILRIAFEHALTVIDLRLVFDEPDDYANPIEPSSHGGAKIAKSIVRALQLDPLAARVARVVAA